MKKKKLTNSYLKGYLNKAFTLIELLAIIVILAIIAVITVPIILNVIEKAEKGAAISSAYNYKDAVYKAFYEQLMEDSSMEFPSGNFVLVNENTLNSETSVITVNVQGNVPDAGSWVELREGEVVAFSLKIGDYIVTQYENEEISAVKGTVVADNPELRDRNNAIIKAQEIINNTDITGKNNQLFEIEDGWVAVVNNEIIGYSVKVTENGKNYVVTLNNGTTTCVIKEELDSSDDAMISIIKSQVATYITELSNDDTIKSITEDKVLKVSEITTVTKPSGMDDNSWIYVKNNEGITDYSLKIGDYVADYSEDITITKDGTIRTVPVVRTVVRTIDGVGYYNTEWIGANPVYYNPTTGASCTDYSESNSNIGNTVGCLKWYAYSEKDGDVNLLLDHNTTTTLAWVTSSDYGSGVPSKAESLGITYPNDTIAGNDSYGSYGNWNKGPITLLNQLKSDTNGWNEILNRTDSYTNINNKYGDNTTNYTISYSGYKARIITAQEVANIVGFDSWDETSTSSSWFYFDNHGQSTPSTRSYGWLYDRTSTSCTTRGCLNNSDVTTYGYWTVSSDASGSYNAWFVSDLGRLYRYYVYHGRLGIRPVITVSKSNLSF